MPIRCIPLIANGLRKNRGPTFKIVVRWLRCISLKRYDFVIINLCPFRNGSSSRKISRIASLKNINLFLKLLFFIKTCYRKNRNLCDSWDKIRITSIERLVLSVYVFPVLYKYLTNINFSIYTFVIDASKKSFLYVNRKQTWRILSFCNSNPVCTIIPRDADTSYRS